MLRLLALMLVLLVALLLTGCGVLVERVTVGPQEVGIVFDNLSGELLAPLGPGVHVVEPWQEVIIVPTVAQELTFHGESSPDRVGRIEARSADGYATYFDVTVLFYVDFENINLLYARWGDRYPDHFVAPTVRRAMRDAAARYTAIELLTIRDALHAEIVAELAPLFIAEGLVMQEFIFRDVRFPPDVAETLQEQLEALDQ